MLAFLSVKKVVTSIIYTQLRSYSKYYFKMYFILLLLTGIMNLITYPNEKYQCYCERHFGNTSIA